MSWAESPGPPPTAGFGLLQATEFIAVLSTVLSTPPWVGTIFKDPILFIMLALALVFNPPPTKYFTVKVVLEGTSP